MRTTAALSAATAPKVLDDRGNISAEPLTETDTGTIVVNTPDPAELWLSCLEDDDNIVVQAGKRRGMAELGINGMSADEFSLDVQLKCFQNPKRTHKVILTEGIGFPELKGSLLNSTRKRIERQLSNPDRRGETTLLPMTHIQCREIRQGDVVGKNPATGEPVKAPKNAIVFSYTLTQPQWERINNEIIKQRAESQTVEA